MPRLSEPGLHGSLPREAVPLRSGVWGLPPVGGFQRRALWHDRAVRFLIPLCLFLAASSPFAAGAEAPAPLLHALNTDPSETKRLEALAKLEKGGNLDARQISRSISDTSARIRAAMVRVGAPLAANDPDLELRLIALSFDRTPEVQRELLKALPGFKHPSAKSAFRRVLQNARQSSDSSLQKLARSFAE